MAKVNLHQSIESIGLERWNALCGTDYPFLRYEFLHALEASGSVGPGTGWQPLHLELSDAGETSLLMPLYLKSHSWGEYVFDWIWADAYERHGLNYYPKLLTAVPFTPATGPRFGTRMSHSDVMQQLPDLVHSVCSQTGASSWHGLFLPQPELQRAPPQLQQRLGAQYHWFNRDYRDFDDFLDRFNSRKRKAVRRERKKVQEQGISLKRINGQEISSEQLDLFYRFYQMTYLKRGRQGYLAPDFFHRLHQSMPEQLLLVLAEREGDAIAAALCFIGEDTLYGRYWGCAEEYDCLHFEACYYQGIEFCIERGLARFDPGAQGEHKIQRGFEPVPTGSLHWIAHPGFDAAIRDFLKQETPAMQEQIKSLTGWLPFKPSAGEPG
ncbi:GNAT family N-acetyltransferase [Marinobacterium sp. MBR-109]|jgi:predicted N-acyltransferase|uniref:GNAT family N-acetyltransferase n=1 Tax=Marinobacterium sp. MBR-109 TaxID=3156462 RepID=UPI0033911D4C